MDMEPSENLFNLIEEFEGLELNAYKDIAGYPTIGYGHTHDVKVGDECTKEQAEAWLKEDVKFVVEEINQHCKVPLSQGEFDALVSFAFNLGAHALLRSTLWRRLNNHDYKGAADEFTKWNRAGGKEVNGLTRRRKAEKALFIGGVA